MLSLVINGQQTEVNAQNLRKLGDVLELAKTMLDPDHMITGIRLNGQELTDTDWTSTASNYETAIVEIESGPAEEFVAKRLELSWQIMRNIFLEFRESRKAFQAADSYAGNKALVQAVQGLKAFFEWYGTLLDLLPAGNRGVFDIRPQTDEIAEVCKNICQQQLYQSWWAIGETLEKELEPKLDQLEGYLRKLPRSDRAKAA